MTKTAITKRADPVEQIRIWYNNVQEGLRTTIEAALEIGHILNEQKASMPHGKFLPWLSANVDFISGRTCRNWMVLDRNRDKLKLATVSNLTEAYRLLSEQGQDEELESDQASPQDESEAPEPTDTMITAELVDVDEQDRPPDVEPVIDQDSITDDSFNLQQLKHYWRRASKRDKKAFKEWIEV